MRILYTIILLCLLPLASWWLLFILALAGLLFFRRYYEGLLYFFLYDLLFGLPQGGFLKTQFSFTIILILVFVLAEGYKDRLRFYRN